MKAGQQGFTFIFLLFFVALGGLLLAIVGQLWWMESRRDKETELLFAGHEIRKAIESYAKVAPASSSQSGSIAMLQPMLRLPLSLDDLLEDRRFTPPRRHLRRLYADPLSGAKEWGLVREGERIRGVYSKSQEKPLKTANFPDEYGHFARVEHYSDWKFIAGNVGKGVNAPNASSETVFPDADPVQASSPTAPQTSTPMLGPEATEGLR